MGERSVLHGMSDKAFADVVTIVESEWIAPETCVIAERMDSPNGDMWLKVKLMDGSEKVLKFKRPTIQWGDE